MLCSPTSLVATILKARYFPNSSFLHCPLGRSPSFVWRSLLWGRQSLLQGIRWRVGDGSQILVYQDCWIPNHPGSTILSLPLLPPDIHVANLIHAPGFWNADFIRQHFLPQEADGILKIPLSTHPRQDTIVWKFSPQGTFSVKSAYKLSFQNLDSSFATSSHGPGLVWPLIWKVNLPNKIKIFYWKACRNILPTNLLLLRRKILQHGLCPLCRSYIESVDHALWSCPSVQSIWHRSPLLPGSVLGTFHCSDFLDRLLFVFSTFGQDSTLQFITTAWLLWRRRNLFVHGNPLSDTDDFWQQASQLISDFTLSTNPSSSPRSFHRHPLAWSPPSAGSYKVNTDAAFSKHLHRAGLGVVIRNSSGLVIMAAAFPVSHISQVDEAEALALLKGFSLSIGSHLSPLQLETDALSVVNLCNHKSSSRLEVDNIIFDIQFLMSAHSISSVSFVPRNCNKVAHCLAQFALHSVHSFVWDSVIPSWLSQAALSDVSSVPSL